MPNATVRASPMLLVERPAFQQLLDTLVQKSYHVIGPTLRENAIVLDEVRAVEDLPVGYRDVQEKGSYRLKKSKEPLLFGYVVGPQSWKRYLSPPRTRLWHASRDSETHSLQIEAESVQTSEPLALFGVRPCELAAIGIQDRVFLHGPYADPIYKARREKLFIVAVNCAHPGGTCFCASMNSGPHIGPDMPFDLALTEVYAPSHHYFVVQVGSEAGAEVLQGVEHQAASPEALAAADHILAEARANMGRRVDTESAPDLKTLLNTNFDHTQWDSIAARCLMCGNCTMVCPTCFCTTVEDSISLDGSQAERWRTWDSCFTAEYSYIFSGSVRASPRSRYRQWLTHKFSAWIDQFGVSGCVGCGRCITWCPAKIDITEELATFRSASAPLTEPVEARKGAKR